MAKGHQVAAALRLEPRTATDMLLRMLEDIDEAEVASPPGDVDPGVNADANVDAADAKRAVRNKRVLFQGNRVLFWCLGRLLHIVGLGSSLGPICKL